MSQRMRIELASWSTVLAVLVSLTLGSGRVHAAEPTGNADLIDIAVVYDAMHGRPERYAAVGCDGAYPAKTARIQVVDPRSGTIAWQATVESPNACLWSVLGTADVFYASGYIADDDGDNGDNLLVQAYAARGGQLLWEKEFEAPNRRQDIVKRIGTNEDDLQLLNGKLLVWAATTGPANQTILLRLDAATGALLPRGAS